MKRARALIGWMPEQEGARWLAGREFSKEGSADHSAICRKARQAVANRPANFGQKDLVTPVPDELMSHLNSLAEHPLGENILKSCGQPQIVDLGRVCAAQPTIDVDASAERVRTLTQSDQLGIAKLTLPTPETEPLPVTFDATRKAWVFSSPNPNLRAHGQFQAPLGPGLMGYGFIIGMQKSYLQVALVNGRYFLRDGYHRAYGLLAKGIHRAAALVKEFDSYEEAMSAPGSFASHHMLSDRPPVLLDYFDDEVSVDTILPITRKTIVVQALEVDTIG